MPTLVELIEVREALASEVDGSVGVKAARVSRKKLDHAEKALATRLNNDYLHGGVNHKGYHYRLGPDMSLEVWDAPREAADIDAEAGYS